MTTKLYEEIMAWTYKDQTTQDAVNDAWRPYPWVTAYKTKPYPECNELRFDLIGKFGMQGEHGRYTTGSSVNRIAWIGFRTREDYELFLKEYADIVVER